MVCDYCFGVVVLLWFVRLHSHRGRMDPNGTGKIGHDNRCVIWSLLDMVMILGRGIGGGMVLIVWYQFQSQGRRQGIQDAARRGGIRTLWMIVTGRGGGRRRGQGHCCLVPRYGADNIVERPGTFRQCFSQRERKQTRMKSRTLFPRTNATMSSLISIADIIVKLFWIADRNSMNGRKEETVEPIEHDKQKNVPQTTMDPINLRGPTTTTTTFFDSFAVHSVLACCDGCASRAPHPARNHVSPIQRTRACLSRTSRW